MVASNQVFGKPYVISYKLTIIPVYHQSHVFAHLLEREVFLTLYAEHNYGASIKILKTASSEEPVNIHLFHKDRSFHLEELRKPRSTDWS